MESYFCVGNRPQIPGIIKADRRKGAATIFLEDFFPCRYTPWQKERKRARSQRRENRAQTPKTIIKVFGKAEKQLSIGKKHSTIPKMNVFPFLGILINL
jgi:hypothetical protein